VVDASSGEAIEATKAEGVLCIADSWPGQMRTVWGDHKRFEETYFSQYPGMYFTGDGCRRDEDGYYWITGRVDDVLNVSGHRMGTAEIESALVAHECVAEAAVVGFPHDIKGQGIYAYVTLMRGVEPTDQLRAELSTWVRQEIGPIAKPDLIQWAPGLPKTRSGKIIAPHHAQDRPETTLAPRDISTLADPKRRGRPHPNRMNRGTEYGTTRRRRKEAQRRKGRGGRWPSPTMALSAGRGPANRRTDDDHYNLHHRTARPVGAEY
jgi:acetyl-CoA synthetase